MPYYPPAGTGSGAPTTATYITQTSDAGLSAEQALASLSTGLMKVTTGTGVVSTAVSGTDYQAPIGTVTGLAKGNGANALTSAVDGTDYWSPAYAIPNANNQQGIISSATALQSQIVVSGTAYYITNSAITMPASSKTGGGMSTSTRMRWVVGLTKTGAGTGTFQLRFYRGTNGSTADTADATVTLGTQTAVIDSMVLDVTIAVTATGATGSYFYCITPMSKAGSATGFGITTGATFTGTVSSVALNTASLKFGLGFIATTGTPTITTFVHEAYAMNMS